jgi:hypothetical protein
MNQEDVKYRELFMEENSPLRAIKISDYSVHRDVLELRQHINEIAEVTKYSSIMKKYGYYILRFDADLSQIIPEYLVKINSSLQVTPTISKPFVTQNEFIPSPTAEYAKGVTIITAYYQLNKAKYSINDYKLWIQRFVSLQCDMIIFTDQQTYGWIKSLRHPKNTRVYLKNRDEFEVNKYDEYWKYCYSIDQEKYHSEDLYKIWSERFISLTQEAIRINPFGSKYLFWVDMGSFRKHPISLKIPKFPSFDKINRLNVGNKFILSAPHFFEFDYIERKEVKGGKICTKLLNKEDGQCCNDRKEKVIQGGFMGGTAEGWEHFHQLYLQHFHLFMNNRVYGGKDQHVLTNMYIMNKDKFKVLVGTTNVNGMYVDEWFCNLFRLAEN